MKFQLEKQISESKKVQYSLFKSKRIREYVDMIQNADLEQSLFAFIMKLKKLYYNRKMNPTKKGKTTRQVKKRYIIGLKEIIKHLIAENLKMVILAVNMEQVEDDNGLDQMVY